MKIHEALLKFDELSNEILKDGKVDFHETDLLLDFIKPYVIDENKRFLKFKKLIDRCREDGKITQEESDELVECIKKMKKFMKFEYVLSLVFISVVYALFAAAIVMGAIEKFS